MNPLKGEAEAKVGDITLKMAVNMDGLVRLTEATGRPTLPELYQRLLGTELSTVREAIRIFTTGGTDAAGKPMKAPGAVAAAFDRLLLSDMNPLQATFAEMLGALIRKDEPPETERPNG